MKNQIKNVILEYQRMIAKLDNKLAVYEQLGTPEEIASKLKTTIKPIPESRINDVVIVKSNKLIEASRNRVAQEKLETSKKDEIKSVISNIPTPQNTVSDLNSILARFEKK